MNPAFVEKSVVKTPLRIIGIFVTVAAVFGAIDGVAIGLGGIEHRNIWAMTFGLGVILSYFGLCGAWLRLSAVYSKMSPTKVSVIRALLMAGISSALLLSVGSVGMLGTVGFYPVPIYLLLLAAGAFLLGATPKCF